MKKIITLMAVVLLAGCAGLDVTYQLQANYKSKELIAKEQAAADRLRNEQLEDALRVKQP